MCSETKVVFSRLCYDMDQRIVATDESLDWNISNWMRYFVRILKGLYLKRREPTNGLVALYVPC